MNTTTQHNVQILSKTWNYFKKELMIINRKYQDHYETVTSMTSDTIVMGNATIRRTSSAIFFSNVNNPIKILQEFVRIQNQDKLPASKLTIEKQIPYQFEEYTWALSTQDIPQCDSLL